MSEPKRYYWLQLSNEFFNSIEIKLLRKIAGGDTYTIIYLKMLLASLKEEGKMYFEGVANDIYEEVALLIDEDLENVKVTMMFLEKKGLLEIEEMDQYFLNQVPSMVGSETSSASRMRRLRANRKKKETSQSDGKESLCDKEVTEKCNFVHESDDINSKSISRDKIDNKHIDQNNKHPSSFNDRFNDLWNLYPNKKGKAQAYKSYLKAVKNGTTDSDIEQGINSYLGYIKKNKIDSKFIKHGSTWFNQRAWEDVYDQDDLKELGHVENIEYTDEDLSTAYDLFISGKRNQFHSKDLELINDWAKNNGREVIPWEEVKIIT